MRRLTHWAIKCTLLFAMLIAYQRVSSEWQKRSGIGLEAQREAIATHCAKAYPSEPIEWYADEGKSGRNERRPQLERALARLESESAAPPTPPGGGVTAGGPPQKILICYSLDRLTRSVVHFGRLLERLNRSGIRLVILRESIDTTTIHGKLVANIMVSVAQWESELAGERTRAARNVVRSRGGALGGRPPRPPEHIALARSTPGGLTAKRDALTAAGYLTSAGKPYALNQIRRMLATAEAA